MVCLEFNQIHADDRRSILANTSLLGGKEISIIKLNKHKAIGGCLHKEDEYYAIVSGCVIVTNGVENTVGVPGDAGIFPAGNPHAFFAEEDSIIMEWGILPENKVDSPKDEDLLNKVKDYNEVIHT